jgi:hypothetical protein
MSTTHTLLHTLSNANLSPARPYGSPARRQTRKRCRRRGRNRRGRGAAEAVRARSRFELRGEAVFFSLEPQLNTQPPSRLVLFAVC